MSRIELDTETQRTGRLRSLPSQAISNIDFELFQKHRDSVPILSQNHSMGLLSYGSTCTASVEHGLTLRGLLITAAGVRLEWVCNIGRRRDRIDIVAHLDSC